MTLAHVPSGSLLLDYSFAKESLVPRLWEARQAGFIGAIRYISGFADKDINQAEVEMMAEAGMGISLVWQRSGRPDVSGPEGGRLHGSLAASMATSLGYPKGGVIFWTADAPGITWDNSRGYAVNFLVEVAAAGYRVGAYGPRGVWAGARDEGLSEFSWQPETWTWLDDQDADVIQMVNSRATTWGGTSVDENQLRTTLPLWFPGSVPEVASPPVPLSFPRNNPIHKDDDNMFRCFQDDAGSLWLVRDGHKSDLLSVIAGTGLDLGWEEFLRQLKADGVLLDNLYSRASWATLMSIPDA